jgi:hypothetical protein
VEELTDATEDWQIEHGADAVWVEDAILYETDTDTQLEAWDELWTNQEKESDK